MLKSITADADPLVIPQQRFSRLPGGVVSTDAFAGFILDTIESMAGGLGEDNARRVCEILAYARRDPVESERGQIERFGLYFYNTQNPVIMAVEYVCNAMLAKREHNRTSFILHAFWYLAAAKKAEQLRKSGVNTWAADKQAVDAMGPMTDSPLVDEFFARQAAAIAA
jgi:hypothetical protein